MLKEFSFGYYKRCRYILDRVFYEILIIRDCRIGKLSFFTIDLYWIAKALFKIKITYPQSLLRNYYETIFGKFETEPNIMGTIIISPSFERSDLNNLIKIIRKELENNKKVLFLDVGAFVGTYSIAIGRAFLRKKNLQIISFEPNTSNFSMNAFNYLKKNIKINNTKNVKALNVGLGSKTTARVNSQGIKTKKLDDIFDAKFYKKFDVIVIKMDIEGTEKDALEGSRVLLDNGRKIYLMIEDCVDKTLIKYLDREFIFLDKLTPFNSFWIKKNR